MQSVLKSIIFYLLLGFPFTKHIGVSSDFTDETTLVGPNVCKRIEEYVLKIFTQTLKNEKLFIVQMTVHISLTRN